MRIHDEELGPMRWHVQLKGERITAEAIVETTRVQDLLRNHQDVLEAKMNALGVEVEDFDVSVDQGSRRFTSLLGQKETGRFDPSGQDREHPDEREPLASTNRHDRSQGLDLYV
jgi:flagellar hook-length control protein FliK